MSLYVELEAQQETMAEFLSKSAAVYLYVDPNNAFASLDYIRLLRIWEIPESETCISGDITTPRAHLVTPR